MKHFINFQYMPAGAARPLDQGQAVELEVSKEAGPAIIPMVGDIVSLQPTQDGEVSFSGKVTSRLFNYFLSKEVQTCAVNIVVQEDDSIDWGALIKE